jgi:hypothetical protein
MDELNSHARALLDAANTFDDPTDMDRDRVRAAVLMRVGSVAAVGTATIAAAKASSAAASAGPLLASTLTSAALFSGAAAKLGAVVVIGALATAGAYVAFHPAHSPASAAKPALAPLAAPVGAAIPPAAVDAQPADVDLPTDDAKPSPAHPHSRNADLEGEMKLLRQADAALRRGDSAAALAAVNKHAALYPTGVLSQEREGVRAIALCSAGSMSQGQAAARRFLAQASKSPLSSRISSACSIDQ